VCLELFGKDFHRAFKEVCHASWMATSAAPTNHDGKLAKTTNIASVTRPRGKFAHHPGNRWQAVDARTALAS